MAHPTTTKIAFTGSSEVGRKIREATAESGKALTLELGGKSPFIVFDEADLDSAVEGVVDSIFFQSGVDLLCFDSRADCRDLLHQTATSYDAVAGVQSARQSD